MDKHSEKIKKQLETCIEYLEKIEGYDNTLKRAKRLLKDVSEETAKRKDFQGMIMRLNEAVEYIRQGG